MAAMIVFKPLSRNQQLSECNQCGAAVTNEALQIHADFHGGILYTSTYAERMNNGGGPNEQHFS